VSGDDYKPKAFSQFVLVLAHNFSQTTPNAIANHRASEPLRRDETCTPRATILNRRSIQYQEVAAARDSVPFHTLVF
jgi:hypothetical protein